MTLDSFSPEHLADEAKKSGFFHCRKCGLVWFGPPRGWPNTPRCPEGPHHGKPVHVSVYCTVCDEPISIERFAEHLTSENHVSAQRRHSG
jgi:rubredoxin